MTAPIEDYALIGDCQTAALIERGGSLDWLCLPRFDSGACFAALLGKPEHGRWLLAPAGKAHSSRRYKGDTLVLETEHRTGEGVVTVTDFMPVRAGTPNLVRLVEGKSGRVAMHTEIIIRFDYGSAVPWVQRTDEGIWAIGGPDSLRFHTPVKLRGRNLTTVADFTVEAGQRVPFVMAWHPSHEPPPPGLDAHETLQRTLAWWEEWSGRCKLDGRWRPQVLRALITLKALTYMPTGGIVAAATTSLPEWLGSVRNWDYRYCWLRDATFTLYSLLSFGYLDEARAWQEWLLRAVAGDPNATQIMYGLAGERRLTEYEVGWLPGYAGSRPVRIGNAASGQFQLDVYGEVLDTMFQARKAGLKEAEAGWKLEKALTRHVARCWQEPDDGIWEVRGPRQHFTHSKVMAWVAVDRAVKSMESFKLPGPLDDWRQLRHTIHEQVCRHGFDSQMNAFVQAYGSKHLDASVLMIPLVGFLPADDPRMQGTVAAIEKHLVHDGFVARYDTTTAVDGLPPGEGVFLPCTFWLADNLVLQGRQQEAEHLYERLLGLCNDVGLLAEEYDPRAKRQLGNYPQAFSLVGLVNTALNLTRAECPARQRHCT
jgi:GH15 family glucan-1,4-alpha-glucosidase